MNAFFQDNFIITKELEHLSKQVKKNEMDEVLKFLTCLNKMQNKIIEQQKIDVSKQVKKNAKRDL